MTNSSSAVGTPPTFLTTKPTSPAAVTVGVCNRSPQVAFAGSTADVSPSRATAISIPPAWPSTTYSSELVGPSVLVVNAKVPPSLTPRTRSMAPTFSPGAHAAGDPSCTSTMPFTMSTSSTAERASVTPVMAQVPPGLP
ncbi:MAG: hypothetical protein AAF715_30065 [Myxococcota bacterium]